MFTKTKEKQREKKVHCLTRNSYSNWTLLFKVRKFIRIEWKVAETAMSSNFVFLVFFFFLFWRLLVRFWEKDVSLKF